MEERNSLLKKQKKPDHRLKLRKHFAYIYRKGKRTSSKYFTLYEVNSKFQSYKIGYSISKKHGKANKRNLLKRRLREIVRSGDFVKPFKNYVLLAREGIAELEFLDLKKQVEYVFNKANSDWKRKLWNFLK